jgi:hypothetical protein
MTLGGQTAAFGLLIAVSACSIQNDVPGFTYPPSTLTGAVEEPVLQPTGDLIVDASKDEETYIRTITLLDGRAYRLRRAVLEPAEP